MRKAEIRTLTADGQSAVRACGLGEVTSLTIDIDTMSLGINPSAGFDDLVRFGQWPANEVGVALVQVDQISCCHQVGLCIIKNAKRRDQLLANIFNSNNYYIMCISIFYTREDTHINVMRRLP